MSMLIDTFTAYQDEFGKIDANVLREAENLSRYSRTLGLKILNDEQKGQTLLMQATAKVSEKLKDENHTINHLGAYLFTTFRRLVFAEAKKQSRHSTLEEKYFESLYDLFESNTNSEEEKICCRILIKEIEAKMDKWTKEVTQYRELGYEFKDLVPRYGKAANVISATYSRKLKELAAKIQDY